MQALRDLSGQRFGLHDAGAATEAGERFQAEDDYIGSVVFVCRILNLTPEAVRDALKTRTIGMVVRGLGVKGAT